MAIKIIYSQISKNDLREIFIFIKKGSLKYAKIEVVDIRDFIKKLKSRPQIGKQFEESEDEKVREVVFKNYRIIYKVDQEDKINILTIHHHARSLGNNPAFPVDDQS